MCFKPTIALIAVTVLQAAAANAGVIELKCAMDNAKYLPPSIPSQYRFEIDEDKNEATSYAGDFSLRMDVIQKTKSFLLIRKDREKGLSPLYMIDRMSGNWYAVAEPEKLVQQEEGWSLVPYGTCVKNAPRF